MGVLLAGAELTDFSDGVAFLILLKGGCACLLACPFAAVVGVLLIRVWNVRRGSANPAQDRPV